MEGIHTAKFSPGTLLAERYEVLRFLGSGGMGSVLLVSDRALHGSRVVLKFLHPQLVPDEQQFKRFQNEALLMRELQHPNIVRVFDIGKLDNGLHFLSMEYVDGQTLGQFLEERGEKRLRMSEALPILYAIAAGLAHAHEKGIVHRDLKPDNVLVNDGGAVKVTDFGLGKALEMGLSLTDPGETVGTPFYMSPEQLRGERPDPRSDIYSFGIMAFEIFTGSRPFNAPSFLELAKMHLSSRIPQFAGKNHGLPAWLQDFVEKCTAKSKDARFSSFAEILGILAPHINAERRAPSHSSVSLQQASLSKHWRLKWRLRHPRTMLFLIPGAIFVVTAITILLAGRVNQGVRLLYAPKVLQLEQALGVDLHWVKWAIIEPKSKDHVSLTNEDLIKSVSQGRRDQVELLLAAGMSPDLRDKNDTTMIQLAISSTSAEVVELLTRYGADLTVENTQRQSLIIQAAAVSSPQVVAAILKSTPPELQDIDAKDALGNSALHYAIARGSAAIVEILIREGASVFLFDSENNTPLVYAVRQNNPELVRRILIKTGNAGIDTLNKESHTALHFAAVLGDLKILQMLLSYGANPNIADASGKTPLILAVQAGRLECVKALMEADSKLAQAKDQLGKTALDYAAGRPDILELL